MSDTEKHPHLTDAECAAMLILSSQELQELLSAAQEAGTLEELMEDPELQALQLELEELAPFATRWAEQNAPSTEDTK